MPCLLCRSTNAKVAPASMAGLVLTSSAATSASVATPDMSVPLVKLRFAAWAGTYVTLVKQWRTCHAPVKMRGNVCHLVTMTNNGGYHAPSVDKQFPRCNAFPCHQQRVPCSTIVSIPTLTCLPP